MQEVLLTSTSLYFDIASTLLCHYEQLESLEDKIVFVEDLKLSIINETLLDNINEQNYSVLIAIILRLCTAVILRLINNEYSLAHSQKYITKH